VKGKLYLVPVTLGTEDYKEVIPADVVERVKQLRKFVVEDLRSARRFLRMIDKDFPIDKSEFQILNEHTTERELEDIVKEIGGENDTGLLSEAGVPCVADPGSALVRLAHRKAVRVVPLTGPSSILLALMASGMNGQKFMFNGYIPIRGNERSRYIRNMESEARKGIAQVFIEAPYRNKKLLDDLLDTCLPDTELCLAVNITAHDEFIKTLSIKNWKAQIPDINKKPAIFILG
jgi:16S rRNA (cytidine1402-2'-O)-methyltransferase